ncbi:MAG: hypothetical protein WBA53_14665 [Burkholderiaceae bacterium]
MQSLIRDFSRIRRASDSQELFSPVDSAASFDVQVAWLARRLKHGYDGPTVVITHRAPSPRSIHPRFAASPVNPAFVSDATHRLDGARACPWIHGHTHDSFDYVERGTRVLCKARGYAKDGVNENPLFDPELTVEIDTAPPLR